MRIKRLVMIWVLLMVAGVFTAGCTYAAFQQTQRDDANVPAAMAAKQALSEMDMGKSPQDALPALTNGVETITPFVLIYDNSRNLVASSLTCDTGFAYPTGCFDQMDKNSNGEYRVTWQPSGGLRFATVGVKYTDGYVVGAYSLEESEANSSRFFLLLVIGSAVYAAVMAGAMTLFGMYFERNVKD